MAQALRPRLVRLQPQVRSLVRRAGLPPLSYWPAAVPGAAPALEWAWARTLRRPPAIAVEEQAAAAGVGPIEEVIGCALCGGRRVQPLFHPARANWSYDVVRCTGCGFLFRSPGIRPERLGDLYARRYSRFLTGGFAQGRQRPHGVVFGALAPPFCDGAGRRLLDYGCGAGAFLELAHRRGFDGYGVDLSPDSVEVARSRPGGANTYVGNPARDSRTRAGRLRRRHDVVGARAPAPTDRGSDHAAGVAHERWRAADLHRQRQLAAAEGDAQRLGRLHQEPPDGLLADHAARAPPQGGLQIHARPPPLR